MKSSKIGADNVVASLVKNRNTSLNIQIYMRSSASYSRKGLPPFLKTAGTALMSSGKRFAKIDVVNLCPDISVSFTNR